jgi:hypothetical protein
VEEDQNSMWGMRSLAKLAVLSLLLAMLAAPSGALATTWNVNDASGAAPNASPDTFCDAPGPLNCTLPEAVLEANADSGDTIHFTLPAATTIALTVSLDIDQPMTIDGCNGGAATAPCVGIDGGTAPTTTFAVFGNGTAFSGLAVGGGHPEAIFATGGMQGLTVRNSWFGLTINGTAASGSAGLDLRGTNAMIGGTAPGDRNVFANNAGEIRILGGTNNQVVGNYFGVAPDGITAAPTTNSPAVLIDANGMTPATGNVVGGITLASENLISNTTGAGAPAIRVNGLGETGNRVLRNRGTGNAGPFVDVTPPVGLGNDGLTGANNGVQAPTIQAAAGLLFGMARPSATVLVYQGNGNAGDLIGFIGVALADGSGAWSLACPSAGCLSEPSTGTSVTANQTDSSGNSSELSGQVAYIHSIPAAPAPPAPAASTAPTGLRAAALKKCKKKRTAAARRKCKRKANALPV